MRFFPALCLSTVIFSSLVSTVARAYPEFIGYGYKTCITCHYNGQGNGPINDYGRAVWSAEIAGRLFAGNATDEQLGEHSGFLGKTDKLPWWIRPGIKARNLLVQTNPGGTNSGQRSILMQGDMNLALLFDKKAEFIVVGSYGYAPQPMRTQNSSDSQPNMISREHYMRLHATKNWWLYLGFMDKVYGIRHVNHTAYSRAMTGLAQNDQSHALVAHYIQPTWELTLNPFFGNLSQQSDLRQQGLSALYDYEMGNNWRLGSSVLASTNKYVKNTRLAVHSRSGYGDGAALLFELGFINDAPVSSATSATTGYYMFSELTQRLVRGYHFFVGAQGYKPDMSVSSAENLKATGGLLMFPMARTELRIEFENGRKIFEENVSNDSWAILSQLHISL